MYCNLVADSLMQDQFFFLKKKKALPFFNYFSLEKIFWLKFSHCEYLASLFMIISLAASSFPNFLGFKKGIYHKETLFTNFLFLIRICE